MSTLYLGLTFILKDMALTKFEDTLLSQNIAYIDIDTRPSPLNTILWNANIDTKENYLLADYSFFDSQDIVFQSYPKNHKLLGNLIDNEKVKRMIAISQGWFTITITEDKLFYNDLRFGLMSLEPNAQDFVFKYLIEVDKMGNVSFIEQEKTPQDGKKLMSNLWKRMRGN